MSLCPTPKLGIPDAKPMRGPSALLPGDIEVIFQDSGIIYDAQKVHAQTFNVNIPLGRTVIQRLGQNFYYTKMLDFPFNVSMSFSALVSEVKATSLLLETKKNIKQNITINLKKTKCYEAGLCSRETKTFMSYELRGAVLDENSYKLSLGDLGRMLDFTYTAQMGSVNDFKQGVFMNGDYFMGNTIITEEGSESLLIREEDMPPEYFDGIITERDGKKDEDLEDIETSYKECP